MTELLNSQAAASSAKVTPSPARGKSAIHVGQAAKNNTANDADAASRTTRNTVDVKTVERALRLVDATKTEPMLIEWRVADKKYRRGPSPAVSNRAALAAALILAEEGTPLFIIEFATLFRTRLTPEARRLMGVENLPAMADNERDERAWYARCWRTVHSIIDTFNAWPAPGRLMSLEERIAVIAHRDPEMEAVKSARGREFTSAWLEMTLQTLPGTYRNAWQGALSADQTAVRAVSQLMPWRRNHRLPGSPEVPELRQSVDDNGDEQTIEVFRPVLEIDATPYPRRGLTHARSTSAAYEMAYAANITLMVTEADKPQAHPQLILTASLHRFGRSAAEHTLAGVTSIQARGWKPNRLTVDRAYSMGLTPAKFHDPLSQLGVQLLTDRSRLDTGDGSNCRGAEAGAADEWVRDYAHARQASESLSVQMKAGRGRQGRMRGLAAQSFVFTFIAAATNLRRIDTFLSDRDTGVHGPRKRGATDRARYRRAYEATNAGSERTA